MLAQKLGIKSCIKLMAMCGRRSLILDLTLKTLVVFIFFLFLQSTQPELFSRAYDQRFFTGFCLGEGGVGLVARGLFPSPRALLSNGPGGPGPRAPELQGAPSD